MLGGSGQAWLDDVAIDVVSNDVPTTGQPGGLYPAPKTSLSARDLDQRRREQEVAYRRAPGAPQNLALRRDGAAIIVAASTMP